MHGILDDVMVGAVLAASIIYAAFSLGPKVLRQRALQGAAAALRRVPGGLHVRGMALRLEAAAMKGKGACGGCDNCGGQPSATTPTAARAAEVRVPLSTIGRR